jgi:hypothetical protein
MFPGPDASSKKILRSSELDFPFVPAVEMPLPSIRACFLEANALIYQHEE